jgi:Domain of unknown function (DUF1918)
MKAQVGDELIIESPEPGTSDRIGTIVALQNADGSPPYIVHWLVGDYDSLIELRKLLKMASGRTDSQAEQTPTTSPSPFGMYGLPTTDAALSPLAGGENGSDRWRRP